MVRAYEQFRSRQGALAKNTFMTSMKDQNVVLYYKVSIIACWVFESLNICHIYDIWLRDFFIRPVGQPRTLISS